MTAGADTRFGNSDFEEAAAHFRAGRVVEAETLCRAIVARQPEHAAALQLLGMLVGQAGDPVEARNLLERAAALRPDNAGLIVNLGLACRLGGDLPAAVARFREAVQLASGLPEARYNLAEALRLAGDDEAAAAEYRRLTETHPRHADGWASLAQLHERRGETEAAQDCALRALACDAGHPVAGIVAAQLEMRRGEAAAARARLEALAGGRRLAGTNVALAQYLLGNALDAERRHADAFDAWSRANATLARAWLARKGGRISPYDPATAARLRPLLDVEPPRVQSTAPAPVFLLGFPRSGTTLLERVLRAHSGVTVVEEQETLAPLLEDFVLAADGVERIAGMDAAALEPYRAGYRDLTRRLAAALDGQLVIDKMPLYTLFLPLIRHVFPDARIILALRDPRDVCLSCFAQNFALNAAMAQFLDIGTTASYYATVMGLGLESLKRRPGCTLSVRYEALIDDLEGEARRILEFLGLEWDPAVLRWRERIVGTRVTTPSYRQIARPLYRSSTGRWHSFAPELAPALPVLKPYVAALGYPP